MHNPRFLLFIIYFLFSLQYGGRASKRPHQTHQPTMINSCAMQPTFHALLVIPYNSFYFSTYIFCKTNQAQFTTYLSSSNAIESDVFKKKLATANNVERHYCFLQRKMDGIHCNHHCAACKHFLIGLPAHVE